MKPLNKHAEFLVREAQRLSQEAKSDFAEGVHYRVVRKTQEAIEVLTSNNPGEIYNSTVEMDWNQHSCWKLEDRIPLKFSDFD